MDDTPLTKRPWFYISAWLLVLLVLYGWQILRMGGVQASLLDILLDLVCIFPVLLILWMAFFAQFVLPVRTFRDRQKIFDRLLADLFRAHGPALFIENGEIKEHSGERLKKGPGVVWLDSASAAVTRTPTAVKQVLGPGAHFIDKGETIAGTIDLHTQNQSLGPRGAENPFAEKSDDQSNEEYQQIQDRRKMVSAWTRDGLEVIPNISITFRVKTGFPKENKPGSRFGYRIGISKKEQETEEKRDKEAIQNAIIGQAVNLNALPDSTRRRLAWNELPAALAVDVWREYAAKFTLDELFSPTQAATAPPEQLPEPPEEKEAPFEPPDRHSMQGTLVLLLHEINLLIQKAINKLEEKTTEEEKTQKTERGTSSISAPDEDNKKEPQMITALQVINEMVKARLTQAEVDILDNTGRRDGKRIKSVEYGLLKARGLKVQSVSISNLRLDPAVDEQLIKQWSASWLVSARAESEQIERKRNIVETSTREEAQIDYAVTISREINGFAEKEEPKGKAREMLRTLIFRSRAMIRSGEHSDQLRRRMSLELQEIEDIIKWVEANGR